MPHKKYFLSISKNNDIGGIANSLVSYTKALGQVGIKHILIVPNRLPTIVELEKQDNVEIFTASRRKINWHIWTRFLFAPDIRRKIKNADTILLHAAGLIRHFINYREKCFVIQHSTGRYRKLAKAKNIIFLTHATCDQFFEAVPDYDGQTYIIPHAFEPFETKTAKHNHEQGAPVKIIAAGRFAPKKNFLELLKAATLLQQWNVKCHINIYGEGEQRQLLENFIMESQLKNVSLHGWTNDLPNKFAAHDIFCLPSLIEPFGLVLGEAMSVGLPVVATASDGPCEILGTESPETRGGKIYPMGDSEGLAHALKEMVENPAERLALGRNAQDNIATRFSFDVLAKNLQAICG